MVELDIAACEAILGMSAKRGFMNSFCKAVPVCNGDDKISLHALVIVSLSVLSAV
jgi:hypothetical protein